MPVFVWMMLVVAFLTLFAMPIVTVALIMVFFDRNFGTTFFLADQGRRSAALPASVLDVRPSRGVHPDPARHGHRLRDAARVLAQAAVRLRGRRVLRASRSGSSAGACGRTTCSRPASVRWRSPRSALVDDAHRDPDRREDLQLVGHRLEGLGASSTTVDAVLARASSRCSPSAGCRACCTRSCRPTRSRPTRTSSSRTSTTCSFGGLVFAVFGGFYYWLPKVFGRMLDERLGKWNFWRCSSGSTSRSSRCTCSGSGACRAARTATTPGSAGTA